MLLLHLIGLRKLASELGRGTRPYAQGWSLNGAGRAPSGGFVAWDVKTTSGAMAVSWLVAVAAQHEVVWFRQ